MQNPYQIAVHLHTQPIVHLLSRPQRIRVTVASIGQIAAYETTGPYELSHRALTIQPGAEEKDILLAGTVRALQALKREYVTPLQKQHQAYLESLCCALGVRSGLGQKPDQHSASETESNEPIKLPVVIATSSQELIEIAEGMVDERLAAGDREILLAFKRQLQRFQVRWRLIQSDNPVFTRLVDWAEWGVAACAKPPLPGLTSAELREVVRSLEREAA